MNGDDQSTDSTVMPPEDSAPRALPADYDPITPPDPTQFGALANERGAFVKELDSNPDLKRTLMQSVYAEVGNQSPRIQQVYLESVMNRALARKQTLYNTITDKDYYPETTLRQLGPGKPEAPKEFQTNLTPAIQTVLGGSNVANYATGNQGWDPKLKRYVLSEGAQITVPHEKPYQDDFVIENPQTDRDFATRMSKTQAQWDTQGQPTTPDAPNVNVLKDVPVPRAERVVPHAQPAKSITQTDSGPDGAMAQADTDSDSSGYGPHLGGPFGAINA
jgi:hypothetical protein